MTDNGSKKKINKGGPKALEPVQGKLHRRLITLDWRTFYRARLIGGGNLSGGIRRAVMAYQISREELENEIGEIKPSTETN